MPLHSMIKEQGADFLSMARTPRPVRPAAESESAEGDSDHMAVSGSAAARAAESVESDSDMPCRRAAAE